MTDYYDPSSSNVPHVSVVSGDATYDTKLTCIFSGSGGQLAEGAVVYPGQALRIAAGLLVENPGGANHGYGIGGAQVVLNLIFPNNNHAPMQATSITNSSGTVVWDITSILANAKNVGGLGTWTAVATFGGQLPAGASPGLTPATAFMDIEMGEGY